MDTSTGNIYDASEIEEALKSGEIKNADTLVELPPEIAQELAGMNRKGRRFWWKQNRKRMNLPRWSERNSITKNSGEPEII